MEGRAKRRLKFQLSIAPYIMVIALSGGYVLKDIGQDVKEAKVIEDVRKDVTITNSPVIIDDRYIEEKKSEMETDSVEEEPKEDLKEEIKPSQELLDEGYEFEQIDFGELKQINSDSDAWIVIDGTKIDLPIVKSTDNEYYLHHDIEKNNSSSGTLFIDYRNEALSSDSLDDITFVYGHHMKNGRMLAGICNYKDEEFYKEHEYGIIYTPDGYAYKASVVACTIVDGESDENIFASKFNSKEEYKEYLDNIIAASVIQTDTVVNTDDKLLALVTCTYEKTNARCIVYFKLEKQYTNMIQIEETMDKTLK